MPLNDREKLNRIEELKSKLFNKDYQTKIEHRDSFPHFQKRDVMDSWQKKEDEGPSLEENFFKKTSMFKKFFIFSIVFFVLALGYAAYMFFGNSNSVSNDNIDISVLSNAFTAGGEDYPLLVQVTNRNSSPLDLVDLVVEYPKSAGDTLTQDNNHLRISLGTIPAGGVKDENLKLVLFGEQGSTNQIDISLEYRVEGSNAIFVKDTTYNVSINSTPINLSVDAPTEATSNQDITLLVKSTLNSTKTVSGILMKIDYPIGFQFVKANPAPSIGNNVWDLGDIAPGAERDISIDGKMVGVFDGDQKIFNISSGTQSDSDKSSIGVVFNSMQYAVSIKKPSIDANLFVNGVSQSQYAIDTKTPVQGQIRWVNNLDTKINNLKITAKISGNAVDRNTISAVQGFYDSSQNLITWDKNYQSNFLEVNPGDSGAVSFSLSSLPLFSASGGIMSSPTINIDVSITGEQAEDGGIITELSSDDSSVINVISDVGLSTKALYYSGPFTNTGPIPPQAEQKTTYTIVWSLSNTANNISKAEVTSTLPPWARFVGSISPPTEDLTYDDSSQQIIWNVGGIPPGTGITEAERNVSFQVELNPSLSQVGTLPAIINNTILTGHDDFANVDVTVNKTSLDTRLLNDPTFPGNGDRVVN